MAARSIAASVCPAPESASASSGCEVSAASERASACISQSKHLALVGTWVYDGGMYHIELREGGLHVRETIGSGHEVGGTLHPHDDGWMQGEIRSVNDGGILGTLRLRIVDGHIEANFRQPGVDSWMRTIVGTRSMPVRDSLHDVEARANRIDEAESMGIGKGTEKGSGSDKGKGGVAHNALSSGSESDGDVPALVTFEGSRYKCYYQRSLAYASMQDARQAVSLLLRLVYAKNGATPLEADRFQVELWNDIEGDIMDNPAKFLVRLWTSAHCCSTLGREWCSCLQEATRLNTKRSAKIVTRIWATMNVFCVTRSRDDMGPASSVPWPVVAAPASRHKEWTLFRGGRIPRHHVSWLQDVCARRCICRVPSALAASPDCTAAHTFMTGFSKPRDAWMVLWRISLPHPPSHPTCVHVQCLQKMSKKKHEIEFIFPPFSAFQYSRIQWVELKRCKGGFNTCTYEEMEAASRAQGYTQEEILGFWNDSAQSFPIFDDSGVSFCYVVDMVAVHDNTESRVGGPVPDNVALARWF